MRRATLIVAVAALLLGFAPFVSTALRTLLLTLAAIAMPAAAFRDYGRVAAAATLVAFTSSAVVLVGGLTAARPAAGSLPTAGVLWWWPLAVGGLLTARLSFELQSRARDARHWLAAFMLATCGAWGLQGRAAEIARVLALVPLSALVGLAIAAFTDPAVHPTWRGPAFLASLAATAGWQAWIVRGIPVEPRVVVPLIVAARWCFSSTRCPTTKRQSERTRRRQGSPEPGVSAAQSLTDTSTFPTLDGSDAHRAST